MTACLPRPLLAPLRSAIRQTTTLHPSNGNPSMYQHTPNAPAGSAQNPGKPLNSGWGNVTPFTMRSSCQFLSLPGASQTPPLGSAQYDADLLQVGALGGTTSIQRTVQETDQARFWADSIGTWTPSGQWPILSDVVVQNNNLTTLQTARLSALVGASLADAGIAAWEAKYTYNTAIIPRARSPRFRKARIRRSPIRLAVAMECSELPQLYVGPQHLQRRGGGARGIFRN
jgi:hypothetical protein